MESSRFATVHEPESSPVELGHADRLNLALLMATVGEAFVLGVECRVCGAFVPCGASRSVAFGEPGPLGVPIIPVCDRCAGAPDWEDWAIASRWPQDLVPIGYASTDLLLALLASMTAKYGPPAE